MDYRLQYNLSGLPEDIQKQVKDFIEFLLSKRESPRWGKKRVFGSAKIVQAMNKHLSVIYRDKNFPAYEEVESNC